MTFIDAEQACGYPPIGSLAAVGDGRSLALLAADGAVIWFCPGRFDGPPLFWSLLDDQKGGFACIGAAEPIATSMRYLPDTAVVEQEWQTTTGTARAIVCMEWPGAEGQQRFLWHVTGVTGHTEINVGLLPKPDFGRGISEFQLDSNTCLGRAGDYAMKFQGACSLVNNNGRVQGRVSIGANEEAFFYLSISAADTNTDGVALSSIGHRIARTMTAWQDWVSAIQWEGPYRETVIRSAITLKLLIYEPTGAVVAAGTAGLPEDIGGVRNWDYRFTWFRDAGLVLDALLSLGCEREAHRWAEWMQNVIARYGTPVQVFYTVDGGLSPSEQLQQHVDGYRQSRPVRTGNAADKQFQLDVYGELLECVFICDTMQDDDMRQHWDHLRTAADFIAGHWQEPDCGIWEVRSTPQHFVHSKVAAWTGLHRALWLQVRHDLEGNHDHWRQQADAIRAEVLQRGVSRDGTRFTRSYEDPGVDASLLLLARFGFVDGDDRRFQNTVDAIRKGLGVGDPSDGLLRRYARTSDDGLPGEEGAFLVCSFWLVDALVRGGRRSEAELIFSRLLSLQGKCGLYAEEISSWTREQLGNVPQAFSHVGLINAALALLDRR